MLNEKLTNLVIASLKAAGITPPELSPIRPFPKHRATLEELTERILASDHEDPYEDPKVVALVSKIYIQSISRLDQMHYQQELERRAAELESNKDAVFEQLQEAFNASAKRLMDHAEPIKGSPNPENINPRTSSRAVAMAAVNVTKEIMALEDIIKAWRDLWAALGNKFYGPDRGKPYIFMNPNAEEWDQLRRDPTIWEAARRGVTLTLADSPQHVSERYRTMISNEQAALEARRESKHVSLLPAEGYGSFKG